MKTITTMLSVLFVTALVSISYGQGVDDVFVKDKAKLPELEAIEISVVKTGFATLQTEEPETEVSSPPIEQPSLDARQDDDQKVMVMSWSDIETMFDTLDKRVTKLETTMVSFEARLAALEGRGGTLSASRPSTGFATAWGDVPTRRVSGGGSTGNYRAPSQNSFIRQLETRQFQTTSNYNGYVLGAGETLVAVNGMPVSSHNPMPAYNVSVSQPAVTVLPARQTFVGNTVPLGTIRNSVQTRSRTVRVPMQATTTSQTTYKPVSNAVRQPRLGSRLGNFLRGGNATSCPANDPNCPNGR